MQAKRVLKELFDTGNQSKRKMTPEEGAKVLRTRFPVDEPCG